MTHPMTMDHIVHRGLGTALTDMTRPILGRARGVDEANALVEVNRVGETPLMTRRTPRVLTPGAEDPDDLLTQPNVTSAMKNHRAPRDPRDLKGMTVKGRTLSQ